MRYRLHIIGTFLGGVLFAGNALATSDDFIEPPKADYAHVCMQKHLGHQVAPKDVTKDNVAHVTISDDALFALGRLYLTGSHETPIDPVFAAKIFERLVLRPGPHQAQSQYLLGKDYLLGEGVTQDSAKGVELLKIALARRTFGAGFVLGEYLESIGDYTGAGDAYRQGATLRDPASMFALANLYKMQRIDAPTPDAAGIVLKLGQDSVLERLARGDCDAAALMGHLYLLGEGIYQNEPLATRWYEVASYANTPESLMILAKLLQKQVTDAAGKQRVFDLWKRSADLGSDKAMYKLGQTYIFGEFASKNPDTGLSYLTESARRQNVEAMRMIYHFYRGDFGGEANDAKAVSWLIQAVHHPNANAKSAYELATYYERGVGVAKDYATAFRYYAQASRMGSDKSPRKLAQFYQLGLSVPPQPRYALRFYRLSSSRGDKDAMMAMYQNYFCGIAVAHDEKTWRRWLDRAFNSESSESVTTLYDLYISQPGEENRKKAIGYVQRGVDFDDRKSMVRLAALYHDGDGVPKDEAKVRELAEEAIAPGKHKKDGLSALSDAYFEGKIVPYDPKQGMALLREGVKLGSAEAARKLGKLLLGNIHGLPFDPPEAIRILERGAEGGDDQAMEALARYYRAQGSDDANRQKTLRWFTEAAENGNIAAIIELTNAYAQGTWLPKDEAQAALWRRYATAPDSCSIEKSLDVAREYHAGLSFPKDAAQARAWFDRALRSVPSQFSDYKRLANAYAVGYGYPPDAVKAAHWYEVAANLGDKFSMRRLAMLFFNGDGVPKSAGKGIAWLEKAIALNDTAAMIQIAQVYDDGIFVGKDASKATRYLEQAATLGSPTAMRRLGFRALAEKNYAAAVTWYTKAAEINDISGMFSLIKIYSDPASPVKDPAKAKHWLERAMVVAKGRADGSYKIGNAYFRGFGVAQDYAIARDWFRQAATLGHARAMHQLGRIYQRGFGVPVDMPQAVAWYERAASLGDAGALTELGIAYANGDGVARDYARAFGYLNSAAAKGASKAMRSLGYLYMRGTGTTRDEAKGLHWMMQAAERHDVIAMEEVARCYAAGFGVTESPADAALWWKRAAADGSPHAKRALETAVKTGYAPASALTP